MMLSCLLPIAALLAHLPVTFAVYADDAWELDYHHALLGTPSRDTTFFHQPQTSSKASLLYTLSSKNVVGAINPRDGSIVWRQPLSRQRNSSALHLKSGQHQDVVISLADQELTAWAAQDGREAWHLELGDVELKDLEILELSPDEPGAEANTKDAIILTGESSASTVRRVDGATGRVVWEYKDTSGDHSLQLSASTTHVYLIALHSTMFSAYKIRVTSLDLVTGRKTDQFTINSDSDLDSAANIISVGANTASPVIAWTDKSFTMLYLNLIGTKTTTSIPLTGRVLALHAPTHMSALPHFLVHYQSKTNHWADVFHVNLKKSTIVKAFSLPKSDGRGAYSVSSFDANVYFTHVSEAKISVFSSTSQTERAEWPLGFLVVPGLMGSVDPVHVVSELSIKGDTVSAARCAILLSTGDWILLRNGKLVWHRPEALAHTVAATWANLPLDRAVIQELEEEAHSSIVHAYMHRVRRHLRDLVELPNFVGNFSARFWRSVRSGDVSRSNKRFGYQKLIVCITELGRVIALDSVKGNIMWNIAAPDTLTVGSSLATIAAHDDGVLELGYTGDPDSGEIIRFLNISSGREISAASKQEQDTYVQYVLAEGEISAKFGPPIGRSTLAWRFVPDDDETIVSVTQRPIIDPVASVGRALGDRRVLFKYLSPNLLMVCTKSAIKHSFTVHLVDGITGNTVKTMRHHDADNSSSFASVMAENWFAYTFTSSGPGGVSKGHQLVIGELYESSMPDDRISTFENHSQNHVPYVVSQSYSIPEPISHMTVTQTRQGITSKALLVVLPQSNALVAIPRMILEPRRPVGRAPTTPEMMEGLMQYSPVLEFDPRWYLNHQRELVGMETVTTSPAVVESTSLVFAYGLDIFGTRISPSASFDVLGKDFNKLQMLATVVALGVVTLFVAPLVQRKQINAMWQ